MLRTKITVLVLLSAVSLAAQTITGSITGTAADPSGAVVAAVKITATNTATNLTYTATTNEAGVYNLVFLPVGNYTLSAESKGFKKTVLGPFALEVNQIARVDVRLEVGEITQFRSKSRPLLPFCKPNRPQQAGPLPARPSARFR